MGESMQLACRRPGEAGLIFCAICFENRRDNFDWNVLGI